jgi:hypothetical protein
MLFPLEVFYLRTIDVSLGLKTGDGGLKLNHFGVAGFEG